MSGTSTTNRLRSAVRGLLLAGLGVVVGLLVAEVALRIMHLAPAEGVGTVSASEYEALPGMFAPNQRVLDVQKPDLPHTVTIDSLGFRGSNFTRRKPPGQVRVVMIGDSFVYGDFVDDDQTLPFQLEQHLRGTCRDLIVINAGLGGTTIVDEARMLQRTLSLDPDLVVLVYSEHDVEDLASRETAWQAFADNRRRKSRFPLSILYPVLRNTALWNLGLKVMATRRKEGDAAVQQQAAAGNEAGMRDSLRERYGAALIAFRDTLSARHVPFRFAMFPSWLDLPAPSEDLDWLVGFAGAHGIQGVNLLPALQATQLPATKLYLVPKDGHPSPMGHSVAAGDLAVRLSRDPDVLRACQR